MKTTFKEILKYYWPHIKKYKVLVFTAIGAYVVGDVVGGALIPLVYKRIIDITTSGVSDTTVHRLTIILFIFAALIIFRQLLMRTGDFLHTHTQSKILKDLTRETLYKVSIHSQEFFSNTFVGALVSKAQRYVRSFEILHNIVTYSILTNIATLVVMLGILVWIKPILALIFIVWLVIYISLAIWFLRRQIPKDLEYASSRSVVTGIFADVVTNILTVKMFTNFTTESRHFSEVTQTEETKRSLAWNWENWQDVFKGIAVNILNIIVISVVVFLWIRGEVSAGTIVLVQVYIFGLTSMTWGLSKEIVQFTQAVNDAREMVEIFEEPVSVADASSPEKSKIKSGEIKFNHVSFAYSDSKSVFNDLQLTIPSGQRVGLVGHSGAGKTTITKLLLRFADVSGGSITIDDQDISKITQDDLRRSISYVPQDPILFHRSLKENIAYGKPDASDEEIIVAAKRARAHEFINDLQKGYDTLVGERGVKLSGGERQRVAIARALLKDAPILILDEATSSLDSISEHRIQEALLELMKGKTTLVVAHRLSTIQNMDRILVLKNGEIVEDGTHTQLIKNRDGIYAELWSEQTAGFIKE